MSTQTLILESPHIVAIEQDKLEPDNETETQAETQDYSAFEGSKRRIPLLLETIIIIIIGLAIILTPGLISIFYYCADVNKTNVSQLFNITANGNVVFGRYIATGMAIEGLPFIIYSVFLSISWCAFFGFRYAFNIVPELLIRIGNVILIEVLDKHALSERLAHYISYARHLKNYLNVFLWSFINLVVWNIMFTNPLKTSFKIISQIFGCCFVISGVWLLEKFLLQAFSIYFHKKVYSERLVKSSHNAYLLTKLAKARKALQRKESTPDVLSPASSKFKSAIDKVKDGVERGAKGFLNISNVTFGYKIENKAGVKHFGEPGRFALKLFRTMVKDNEDGLVSLNNFMPFFSTLDEAVEAFNLFDSDGNGDVSLAEMRECISGIYDEYDFLETSLRNSSQAIEKMDAILKTVMFVILIFVCLGIFNVDTTQFIAIFIALWAGSLFALSGTVKNLVESIIFLFLTHPYDVGDRVLIDTSPDSVIVKEFGLMTTIFLKGDGKEIYAPNSVISTKFIYNIRRSGPLFEEIVLEVPLFTPFEKLEQLKNYLVQYIDDKESRELVNEVTITIKELKTNMSVGVGFKHKTNGQLLASKSARKSRFLLKIRDGLELCGIQLVAEVA